MPQFASYVATEDLVFTGVDFARHWRESTQERPCYAYIIPEPGEPHWPYVTCYFSQQAFTRRELRQLCQWNEAPLVTREQAGEARCGFRWPLDEVAVRAVTEHGEAILQQSGVGVPTHA